MSTIKYKDYYGSCKVSHEDKCLHGKILFINDLVTYEAQSVPEIEKEFHDAVDDYLETCEILGKEPNKPFSGTFQIRVSKEMHREAAISAKTAEISLNEWVNDAISKKLHTQKGVKPQENHTHYHITTTAEMDFAHNRRTHWDTQSSELKVLGQ